MKFFKRTAISEIDKTTKGKIIDSENINDKVTNTYSARVIDEKIAENVPDIEIPDVEIPANYNYSEQAPDGGNIDALAAFTSGKPGMTGSVSLQKKASGTGSEIPAGWYNFIFTPHRTGINPVEGGDNADYGTIILTPMSFSGDSWILRRTSSTTSINEVKRIGSLTYSSFAVTQHALYASGISAYNSSYYYADAYLDGYYPLAIVSRDSFWHNNAGFTVNPIRIENRSPGYAQIYFWAKNDANGATSDVTAYCDVLWVKI